MVLAAVSAECWLLLLIAELNHQNVVLKRMTEVNRGLANSALVVQHPTARPGVLGIGIDDSHLIREIGVGVVNISLNVTVGWRNDGSVRCTSLAEGPAMQPVISQRRNRKSGNYHKHQNDPMSTHDSPRGT